MKDKKEEIKEEIKEEVNEEIDEETLKRKKKKKYIIIISLVIFLIIVGIYIKPFFLFGKKNHQINNDYIQEENLSKKQLLLSLFLNVLNDD